MESIIDRYRRLHSDRKESIVQHFKDAKRLSVLNYYRAGKNGTNNMDYFFYGVMAIKDFLDRSYHNQEIILGKYLTDCKALDLSPDKTYKPSDVFLARVTKNVSYVTFKKTDVKPTVQGLSTNLGIFIDEKRIEKTESSMHYSQILASIGKPSNPYTTALNQILDERTDNSSYLIATILSFPKNLEAYTEDPAHFISTFTEKYISEYKTDTEIFNNPQTVEIIKENIDALAEVFESDHFSKSELLASSLSQEFKTFITNPSQYNSFTTVFKTQEDLNKYIENPDQFITDFQTKEATTMAEKSAPFLEFISNPDIHSAVLENKDTLLQERETLHQDILLGITIHELLHSGTKEFFPENVPSSKVVRHYEAVKSVTPLLEYLGKLTTTIKEKFTAHSKEKLTPNEEAQISEERWHREFSQTARNESITQNLTREVMGKPLAYDSLQFKDMSYTCPRDISRGYLVNQATTNLLHILTDNDKYGFIKDAYLHQRPILFEQMPFWNNDKTPFNILIKTENRGDKTVTLSNVPVEFHGYINATMHSTEHPSYTFDAMLSRTEEVCNINLEKSLIMAQRTQQMLLETYKTGAMLDFQNKLSEVKGNLPSAREQRQTFLQQQREGKNPTEIIETLLTPFNTPEIEDLQMSYFTMKSTIQKAFTSLTLSQDKSLTTKEERLAAYEKYGCKTFTELVSQPQTSETINDLIANNIIAPSSNIVEYVQLLETMEMLEENHPILSSLNTHSLSIMGAYVESKNTINTPQPVMENNYNDPVACCAENYEDVFDPTPQTEIIPDMVEETKVVEQIQQTEQTQTEPTTIETESFAIDCTPADDMSQ